MTKNQIYYGDNLELWSMAAEEQFFIEALRNFASPEQLFYLLQGEYWAYIPKGFDSEKQTLQSRNSLIGAFTEKWCKLILEPIALAMNLHAVNGVVCEEIGLSKQSSADLALCTSNNTNQEAKNIKLIFEIKMSIVSNYKLLSDGVIEYVGDYKTHKGQPSLLRSDSMLKAIGKAVNIRVASAKSAQIPIIVLGNSPISSNYSSKIDFLKTAGVIQGFWSLNSSPTDSDFIDMSADRGFRTIKQASELFELCCELVERDWNYFSAMLPKSQLGQIIHRAGQETSDIGKAEKFLELIRTHL